MFTYVYMCIYVYIYIYIYICVCMYMYICICIYFICMYMYVCTYIYIDIYLPRISSCPLPQKGDGARHLCDDGGVDSAVGERAVRPAQSGVGQRVGQLRRGR